MFYSKRFKKWALVFPVIDRYIVMKSSSSFKEYGKNLTFREYMLFPSLLSVIVLITGLFFISILSRYTFMRRYLLSIIPSGDGPSKEEREKNWFQSTIIGKAGDKEITTTISGGDPGYGETAKFISEMALCVLLEENKLIKNKGILTPVECTGDLMKKRLVDAGIKIDVALNELF